MNLDDTLAELERAIQQTPYESGATSPAPEPDGPRKYQEVYRDADGATGSRPLSPREQQRKQVWINRANELRRNAVRFEMTRSRSDHRADAIKMLRVWGEDLNANSPPDVWRRATQTIEVFDQHGKLLGWHYDDLWRDSDYCGYQALGYHAIGVPR